MLYATWNSIRLCLFAIHLVTIPIVAFGRQLLSHKASLLRTLHSTPSESRVELKLSTFRQHFVHVHYIAQYIASLIVGKLMFVTLFTNVLVSSFNINIILHEKLLIAELVLLICLLFLEVFLALAGCIIFIYMSDAMHSSGGVLFKTHQYVKSLSVKLKLMTFYEAICTNKRFYFYVCMVGKISRKSLLEVIKC